MLRDVASKRLLLTYSVLCKNVISRIKLWNQIVDKYVSFYI